MSKKGDGTAESIEEYIAGLDEDRQAIITHLDQVISSAAPSLERKMWGSMGSRMIGYGSYHYKYASGREGDWFIVGLASQKSYISVYLCASTDEGYVAELAKERLGKVSVGRSCIRFKKLEDINESVLAELVKETVTILGDSE